MSLEIKVTRVTTRILDVEGGETAASFFLHSVGLLATREESLGERLNDEGSCFLPCEVEDGQKRLIRVARIAYVELAGSSPDLAERDRRGAHHSPIDVELVTGERLCGEVVHESPPGESRLNDVLNRPGARFLLVIREGAVLYLNRDAISWVKL